MAFSLLSHFLVWMIRYASTVKILYSSRRKTKAYKKRARYKKMKRAVENKYTNQLNNWMTCSLLTHPVYAVHSLFGKIPISMRHVIRLIRPPLFKLSWLFSAVVVISGASNICLSPVSLVIWIFRYCSALFVHTLSLFLKCLHDFNFSVLFGVHNFFTRTRLLMRKNRLFFYVCFSILFSSEFEAVIVSVRLLYSFKLRATVLSNISRELMKSTVRRFVRCVKCKWAVAITGGYSFYRNSSRINCAWLSHMHTHR